MLLVGLLRRSFARAKVSRFGEVRRKLDFLFCAGCRPIETAREWWLEVSSTTALGIMFLSCARFRDRGNLEKYGCSENIRELTGGVCPARYAQF
jgi:hypothetical protein